MSMKWPPGLVNRDGPLTLADIIEAIRFLDASVEEPRLATWTDTTSQSDYSVIYLPTKEGPMPELCNIDDLNLLLKIPDPFKPAIYPDGLKGKATIEPGAWTEGDCLNCGNKYHWCVACHTTANTPEWVVAVGYCSRKCLVEDFEGTDFVSLQDFARHLGVNLSPSVT